MTDWVTDDGACLAVGDCVDVMSTMVSDSVDLVFGSPPYCDARTYGINAQRTCPEWVEWMLEVTTAATRVCKGPTIWVIAGVTRKRNYWPAVEGLMWEWWKRGGTHQLYRPCVFHRSGVPGSGGTDWFRSNWEYIVCFKKSGALVWSDNLVCGSPPKYRPGGEMSYRLTDGARKNAFGAKQYNAPPIANPGNVFHVPVGGGQMGDKFAHENEAPFPEKLVEIFVRSFCPSGGIVLDPFVGSGTTIKVAKMWGRFGVGIDLRQSQIDLTLRRLAECNPPP